MVGADARAGRDDRPSTGRPKGRSKEHFLLSEPPGTARSPHAADATLALAELGRLLETDAPVLRALLPPGFADAARRYVELLLDANDRLNLTRVVEPAAVGRLHLLDALSALPFVDELAPRRAIDIGSGGGVPGIVLALARPATRWCLVDSVRKKADALRAMVDALSMPVEVLDERVEILGHDPTRRESADLVTARACAPLPVLVEYALPLLRTGGCLLAWKGPIGDVELTAGRTAAERLGGGRPAVRETGIDALGDHRLVVVEKVSPTPPRYPRRPGEPSRRPLGTA
jgi:16S rRNA (guanine527-N7)-methyltransferase